MPTISAVMEAYEYLLASSFSELSFLTINHKQFNDYGFDNLRKLLKNTNLWRSIQKIV